MKFIELTNLNSNNKFIVPVKDIVTVYSLSEYTDVEIQSGSVKVKETLSEIERKICYLGGDVQ